MSKKQSSKYPAPSHSSKVKPGTPPNASKQYPRPKYRGHPSQYYDSKTQTWHQPR